MKIRKAIYNDIDEVLNLLHELGYPSLKDIIIESLTEHRRSDDYEVLVAEDGDILLGCISLHVTKLFHVAGNAGRITSLVVSPEKRGLGIGKALVNAADQYFKKKGCIKAEVTSSDHRKGAHNFYQSQGFVRGARRFIKNYKTGA
jgi:ribosomal protein S18 acetylase RimI-like enzyme